MECWFKYSHVFLSSVCHNVVVVVCPLMSSAFTADTGKDERKWVGSSRLQSLPWCMQCCRTTAFLELVGIVINTRLGMHIPVVTQLWIKVTSIYAATQIDPYHQGWDAISVPWRVASLLLFLRVCTGSSTMTTLHSDCHSVSNSNGCKWPTPNAVSIKPYAFQMCWSLKPHNRLQSLRSAFNSILLKPIRVSCPQPSVGWRSFLQSSWLDVHCTWLLQVGKNGMTSFSRASPSALSQLKQILASS